MRSCSSANKRQVEQEYPRTHRSTLQELSRKKRIANRERLQGKRGAIDDVNNHLKLVLDPILSDAILFLLVQNPESDLIQLLHNYFKEMAYGNSSRLKSKLLVASKKTRKSSVQRLIMAKTIAPIISQLMELSIKNKLSSSPVNIHQAFLMELEKMIEKRGNFETKVKANPKVEIKNIVILLAGIENSGKSTLMAVLRGNTNPRCKPSMGFCPISMRYKDTCVLFYDLGGGPKIRGIWSNCYHDAHGLIYIIDSASKDEKYDESIKVAKASFLGHKYIQGKPLLIISNKIDVREARDVKTVQMKLGVPLKKNGDGGTRIIEGSLHPQKAKFGGKQDPVIDIGLEWLLKSISSNFEELSQRVNDDCKRVIEKTEFERVEKERRVLRNCICKAFGVGNVRKDEDSCLNKTDGEIFLAMELGYENSADLPSEGCIAAELIGYNKVALMIVAGMIAPKRKNMTTCSWTEVISHIREIRSGISGLK